MSLYFSLALILLYISLILSSLEHLKVKSIYASEGMLSWTTLKIRRRIFAVRPFNQFFDNFYNKNLDAVFVAKILLSVAGIFIVVFYNKYPVLLVQTLILNVVILLYNYRSRYALDGADQLNTIALTCLSLCLLGNSEKFEHFFLLFIAFQLTLAYFIAGIFKITTRKWLSGAAVKDIFGGRVYGSPFVANSFKKFPKLAAVLSVIIISWEAFFPFAFFLNETFFFIYLGIGVLFHLFNAIFMGLNCFFISFVAGYPALVYCYYLFR